MAYKTYRTKMVYSYIYVTYSYIDYKFDNMSNNYDRFITTLNKVSILYNVIRQYFNQ